MKTQGKGPSPQDPNQLSLIQEENNALVVSSVVKPQSRRIELPTAAAAKYPLAEDRNLSGKISAKGANMTTAAKYSLEKRPRQPSIHLNCSTVAKHPPKTTTQQYSSKASAKDDDHRS
jgi:hypothetical protein